MLKVWVYSHEKEFFAGNKAAGIESMRFCGAAEGKNEVKLKFHQPFERHVPAFKILKWQSPRKNYYWLSLSSKSWGCKRRPAFVPGKKRAEKSARLLRMVSNIIL
ncbi:MAG: hypothetical protein PHO08_16365 [Methylococcales bacterium]|nr:hypothetical protein [Methylococcales bacterium]